MTIFENSRYRIETLNTGHLATVVTFGGIFGGLGMPPFELKRTLTDLGVNYVLVVDTMQSWFVGDNVNQNESLADLFNSESNIRDLIVDRPVLVIGNSMGSFGALHNMQIIQPKKILLFSPQSFIDLRKKLCFLDLRWLRQLLRVYQRFGFENPEYDLLNVVNKNRKGLTSIDVYYSEYNFLDVMHSRRLKLPRASYFGTPTPYHGLIKNLRNQGRLDLILRNAIADITR